MVRVTNAHENSDKTFYYYYSLLRILQRYLIFVLRNFSLGTFRGERVKRE